MKKIIAIFSIIILVTIYPLTSVFADYKTREAVEGRIGVYDVDDEYKIEIEDSTNKKIVVRFKDMTIIECYADNGDKTIDLKEKSKINYSNNTHFLYIEYLTDNEYLLDYNNEFKYRIYENNKLKKEASDIINDTDTTRSNGRYICYTFRIKYDKMEEVRMSAEHNAEKVGIVTFAVVFLICMYYKIYGHRILKSYKHGGMVNEKNIEYNRYMPETINLEKAYAALYYCTKTGEIKIKKGIIGAFLLKWFNENNIDIIDNGNRVFYIDLKDGNFSKTEIEQELYDMLKYAAGNNNRIDNNEFRKWARDNKKTIDKWNDRILSNSKNEELKEEAEKLLGLKKFLMDYSLIEEKKHIEVKIWEQYLIYAQLLGISRKVNSQFKKIYPDYSKLGEVLNMDMDYAITLYIYYLIFMIIPASISMFVGIVAYVINRIINFS